MSGMLYLCATPIGNLSDISKRCLEILESVDIIACEDTRRTLQLLNHFGITKQLTSYYEHNKFEKGEYIIKLLKEGKNIALVSDAGTPAISDPGEDLVRLCVENDIVVTSIPGPVAAINALILSGMSTKHFTFIGFLNANKKQRMNELLDVQGENKTMIFYEAPHKLKDTLKDMEKVFGGNRKIALARELTKLHEEILRMTIKEATAYYEDNSPRGEYVLIVEGGEKVEKTEDEWWSELSLEEQVDEYIKRGMTSKDAIKQTSLNRNMSKREVYNLYHKE